MAVLDASVAVKLIAAEPGTTEARSVCFAEPALLAPDWMLVETASALWGKVMRHELRGEDLPVLMGGLPQFFEPLHPATALLDRGMELALRLGHHVYDCLYLALAMQENDRVLTADEEFHRRVRRGGLGRHVELLIWPKESGSS